MLMFFFEKIVKLSNNIKFYILYIIVRLTDAYKTCLG
jgi:hypothetical protein